MLTIKTPDGKVHEFRSVNEANLILLHRYESWVSSLLIQHARDNHLAEILMMEYYEPVANNTSYPFNKPMGAEAYKSYQDFQCKMNALFSNPVHLLTLTGNLAVCRERGNEEIN